MNENEVPVLVEQIEEINEEEPVLVEQIIEPIIQPVINPIIDSVDNEPMLEFEPVDEEVVVEEKQIAVFEPASYDSLHELMKMWATTPDLMVTEDVVLKHKHYDRETGLETQSITIETIKRRLTIRERMSCAKESADYFAPKLKSIEAKVVTDVSNMSVDELMAYANKLMGNDIVNTEVVELPVDGTIIEGENGQSN